jgi:hypothetical protein
MNCRRRTGDGRRRGGGRVSGVDGDGEGRDVRGDGDRGEGAMGCAP